MSIRPVFIVALTLLSLPSQAAPAQSPPLHPALARYVTEINTETERLPQERKAELKKLAAYVQDTLKAGEPANLLFICTHNSRRSHMAQLWAATAAAFFGIRNVHAFSGGTEATAFNPRAVEALRRAGFKLEGGASDAGTNPHYSVTFSPEGPAVDAFSKKYGDAPNPQAHFAAVMTCAQADLSCPLVHGASLRVPLHYEDPKQADGTAAETATYDARCRQIATEMFYLFSQVRP